MPPPILRPVGRHSRTLHVLNTLAYSLSVCGLLIIAEERRRRIAFAQRIIENGRKLQGCKTYATAAPLEIFAMSDVDVAMGLYKRDARGRASEDLIIEGHRRSLSRRRHADSTIHPPSAEFSTSGKGEFGSSPHMRDEPRRLALLPSSNPEHVESPDVIQDEALSVAQRKMLTRDEWLKSQRKKSSLPTGSDVAKLDEKKASSDRDPFHIHDPLSPMTCQNLLPSHEASREETWFASGSASQPKPKSEVWAISAIDLTRYKDYSQRLVADRVIKCLNADDHATKVSGLRELNAYFGARRERTAGGSSLLEDAVRLAWKQPGRELQSYLQPEASSHMLAFVESSQPPTVLNTSNNNLNSSPATPLGFRHFSTQAKDDFSALEFTQSMWRRSDLTVVEIDKAFYHFLALCERSTGSLDKKTKGYIRELARSCKRSGLVSLVEYISTKVASIWKYSNLLRENLIWVMEHGLPDQRSDFCLRNLTELLEESGLDAEVVAQNCRDCVRWFAQHHMLQSAIDIFITIFNHDRLSRPGEESKRLAKELFAGAVSSNCPEDAERIFRWLRKSGVCPVEDGKTLEGAFECFLSSGTVQNALRLCRMVPDASVATREQIAHMLTAKRHIILEQEDKQSSAWLQGLPIWALDAVRRSSVTQWQPLATERLVILHHASREYDQILDMFQNPAGIRELGKTAALVYDAHAHSGSFVRATEYVEALQALESGIRLSNAVQLSHSVLLSRVWQQTRNLELTEWIFSCIKSVGICRDHAWLLYNGMILACAESGNVAKAQSYADEVLELYHHQPDIRAWGLLMYAKGLAGNWKGVEESLKKAEGLGLLPLQGNDRDNRVRGQKFFHRAFREYARQHDAEQVVSFAIKAVDEFKVPPTDFLSDRTIKSILEADRSDLFDTWTSFLRRHNAIAMLGVEHSAALLRRISQFERSKFWPLLETTAEREVSTGHPAKASAAGQTRARRTGFRVMGGHAHGNRRVERQMLDAIHRRRPATAVQEYEESLKNGVPTQYWDLANAVHAALMKHTLGQTHSNYIRRNFTETGSDQGQQSLGEREAIAIIQSARAAGMDTAAAESILAQHRLRHATLSEFEATQLLSHHHARALATPSHPRNHHLTIAVAQALARQGEAGVDAGLRVLQAVGASEFGRRVPFDLAAYTAVLQLLVRAEQPAGVRRVIDAVLARDLRIDGHFLHALKMGRQPFRRREARAARDSAGTAASSTSAKGEEMIAVLDGGLAACRARRGEQRERTAGFARNALQLLEITPESRDADGRPHLLHRPLCPDGEPASEKAVAAMRATLSGPGCGDRAPWLKSVAERV